MECGGYKKKLSIKYFLHIIVLLLDIQFMSLALTNEFQ